MTNYSLRARMMILILAPTVLIGLLLSIFFIVHRYNDLQRQLENAGASIIEPVALASEYGLNFQNREPVGQLVSLLHRRHSETVRAISIFDNQNRLFVTSNSSLDPQILKIIPGRKLGPGVTVARDGDKLIMRTPIVSHIYSADESPYAKAKPRDNFLGYVALDIDLKSVRLQQYKEVVTATTMLLLCVGFSMIFAWRLMRDVTIPIRNMVNTVDRIRRGQLDSRVEGFMFGELDMLKNGINSMAMSLTAYHEEMQHNVDQATSDLRETLEQMEIQNVELDLAKKRAQEAVRIKSEFLANMSHELRTPLNGVIGFTRLTLKSELTPAQRDHLHTIERSANNLLAIINDVLDFSKLEAGKLILENIPFLLHNTLDETVMLLAHAAHDKGLELTLNIRNDVPDNVIGDPLRLQQVITNLAGNAIKFTESGNVNILVEKRSIGNNKVQIEVRIHDTGIGIPERDQSRLFQAFRQADASISRRHGGTGLGLVITQRLIKEMGGDISFHSQLNRGSTFWFHINLDLNPNAVIDSHALDVLAGKRLGYIEPDDTAARSTLDMLEATPLTVKYGPTYAALPREKYDFLLMGVPVTSDSAIPDSELTAAVALTPYLILALPCAMQIEAETLKVHGANACLAKPVTATRLLPLLLKQCRPAAAVPADMTDNDKLSMTVMAVDDNPANLKLIGALLDDLVTHVILCDSGKQALEMARRSQIDIILMDIQMPDMDGIRACKLIRQLPHQQQTPVIAVTAHAMAGQKEQLFIAGMNEYLAKPIEEKRLRALLIHFQPDALQVKKVAALPAPQSTAAETEPPLSTLDWPLALRQSANKPDLARNMLSMLLAFLPEVRDRVEEHLVGKAPDELTELIHKLHGSCSYCGVPRLKKLCLVLEQALRGGTPPEDLEPEWLELLDEMDNVRKAANAHLSQHG